MTHVVSDLAAQIVGRSEPPPPPPAAAPPPPLSPVFDDRAEREQREIAELKFRRQGLRFGDTWVVAAAGNVVSVSRRWVVHQGELDQELEPEQFYALVGRPDLGEAYASRRTIRIAGYVTGGLVMVAGTVLALSLRKDCPIDQGEPTFSMCFDDNRQSFYAAFGVSFGVGMTGILIGLWYSLHPHPISENEAKSLADVYNQQLRRELGLPVVAREPLLRDVKLTPFIGRSDTGGLALSGRF
jgi:hypothetical protein